MSTHIHHFLWDFFACKVGMLEESIGVIPATVGNAVDSDRAAGGLFSIRGCCNCVDSAS